MRKNNKKNNKLKNLLSNQKGMALLTTLIFVFLLVTFGVALLTMTSNDTKLSTLQRDSTKAFYLADAGIDKALWYLNTPEDLGGKGMFSWRPSPSDPEGTSLEYYEIRIENKGDISLGEEDTDKIEITSMGVVKNENGKVVGKRTVIVEAKIGISPVSTLCYNYALAADSILTINGAITINGDIHANGSIGGSNNDPTVYGEQTIGGDKIYPIIDFEYYKQLAIANETYYDYSKVFNTDETITGIHFIDGDVDIKAILNISDGAIFATGEITSYGNAVITHTKSEIYDNPLALVAKGDITLSGTVSTEGVIQSEGDIKIIGTVDVLNGAIVGDNITVEGNVSVTYNLDLQGEVVVGTGIEIYKRISWRESY
jgi:hypothetical protein